MKHAVATLCSVTLLSCLAVGAQATTVAIAADGSWNEFDVDEISAQSGGLEWIDNVTGPGIPQYQGDGSALSFSFTLTTQAWLRVVDAGFAGDRFQIFNGANSLGFTSAVPATTYENNPPNAGLDFDAAFADPANFSSISLLLAPGAYTISGLLTQSVGSSFGPLNATVGAVSVTAAVPVPAALPLLVSGLGLLGTSIRQRARRDVAA